MIVSEAYELIDRKYEISKSKFKPMKTNEKELLEDAKLLVYFLRALKKPRDIEIKKFKQSEGYVPLNAISYGVEDKYKCLYCGCEYTYRRSLISHMQKLHNITNVD